MTKTQDKTQESTDRTYPSAFYAAAGVGDLAYQQLRKLPEVADKLRVKAAELADQAETQAPQWKAKASEVGAKATSAAADLTGKVDPAQVRDAIVTGTQTVAEKATKLYSTLVARGEKAFTEQATPEATVAKATPAESATTVTEPAKATVTEPVKAAATEPAKADDVKAAAKRQPRRK